MEEERVSPLDQLGVKFVDQDELEHDITKKANEALINKDTELDQKRLDKANNDYMLKLRILRNRLSNPRTKISQRKPLKDECDWIEKNELEPLKQDIVDITNRLNENKSQLSESKNQCNQKKSTQSGSMRNYLKGIFLYEQVKYDDNDFTRIRQMNPDDIKSQWRLDSGNVTTQNDDDYDYGATENAMRSPY